MNSEDSGGKGAEEEAPVREAEPNPFWKQNAEKLVGESISSVEDTAKQFVIITGLLEGIYFHAITFSDVKSMEGGSVLMYAAPLVLWLISLIFAVMVLVRKKYGININSSRDSKEKFENILEGKYKLIRISGLFLILSFVALTIVLLHYLGIISYHTF
ncbi:hypothetical protein MSKOL_1932 [Methanosarcina sp. Kolksee]|uniref:hypothetical protein n=1 Tax=Methanosarcina sp. Kolksee TaxID=1434099 RepID=UPI000615B75B|nr:hypothetical protein [Methanosarcina sp. Kolksee]AKB47709.1 hypothetical protein MSKOL_1932 [Methanosarcina sp. Kolksee]